MIYLDANANAALRPEAHEAMLALLGSEILVRNPSSVHAPGRQARALLRRAREQVLSLLFFGEAVPAELVFTSGGTEACNQLIFGFLGAPLIGSPGHIVTSAIEHSAIREPLAQLELCGWEITRVSPNREGVIDAEQFAAKCRPDTALVALMAANNETGAIQPVAQAARLIRAAGCQAPIISDITQAVGKSRFSLREAFEAGVTAVGLSGHKIGAPGGIGALVYHTAESAACYFLKPYLMGGPQEQRLRGGTENLLGAVAFGAAAQATAHSLEDDLIQRYQLRERLWELLEEGVPWAMRLGPKPSGAVFDDALLSNTLLVRFPGCRGDDLVAALDLNGVAASTGSACSSGRQETSATVKTLGLDPQAEQEVIRLSLDWNTTPAEIERAARIIAETGARAREFSDESAA